MISGDSFIFTSVTHLFCPKDLNQGMSDGNLHNSQYEFQIYILSLALIKLIMCFWGALRSPNCGKSQQYFQKYTNQYFIIKFSNFMPYLIKSWKKII